MELHSQQLQLEASSSLTPQQMEVRRLYTLSGIDISNDKFQVSLCPLFLAFSKYVF